MAQSNFTQWIDFNLGKAADSQGRHINDIWKFNHDQLEINRDYISWLFISAKADQFNQSAPFWNRDEWRNCKDKKAVIASVNRSTLVMLNHLGIEYRNKQFVLNDLKPKLHGLWLTQYHHTQLDITQMLTTLTLIGEINVAKQLSEFLQSSIKQKNIQSNHVYLWQKAACGML